MSLHKVLSEWNAALLKLEGSAVAGAGADERAIADAERRLGVRLPSSYRTFLAAHNGWPAPDDMIGTLLPVERLAVLSDEETEGVAMLMDVRNVLSSGRMEQWVAGHRGRLVQIAEGSDGYLLLDTTRLTSEGECEVCFAAAWIPGVNRYRTFAAFMKRQWDSFKAAHPSLDGGEGASRKRLNLKSPPEPGQEISDPERFLSELLRLGYFQYADDASCEAASAEYRSRIARCSPTGPLPMGRMNAPMVPLLEPGIHRCVWLEQGRLVAERAPYAMDELRALLAGIGTELPMVIEELTETTYAASLGDIRHAFFKMKKGMPAKSCGSVPVNAARYYAYASAILTTKYLKSIKSDHRIATIELFSGEFDGEMEIGLVCLTDELSYLLQWTTAIGNECRPLRPDVWG